MSLSTPPRAYKLGIIAARNLDDPDFLPELLNDKAAQVSHLYTNGANPFVPAYAACHGLPCTIFPLTGGSCLPKSTTLILDNSDFVYVIGSVDSKSAGYAASECHRRGIRFKLLDYEPVSHWRAKLGKVAEILAATTAEEVAGHATLKAIARVV